MDHLEKIERTAKRILELLSMQRYDELALLTRNNYPVEDIQFAMEAYDATACEPPASFGTSIDVIEIEGSTPVSWRVIFPVWTIEEGQSDLSVNITCISDPSASETFEFDLNGIYVL